MSNTPDPATPPGDYATHLGYVTQLGAGVMEFLAPKPGEKVLDVGCGDGTHVEEMLAKNVDAYGFDPDPEQIATARGKGIEWHRALRGSAEAMPDYPAGFFDAVFSNAALHYVLDIAAGLRNMAHVLKDGGRLVAEMGGSFSQDLRAPNQSNLEILQTAVAETYAQMHAAGKILRSEPAKVHVRRGGEPAIGTLIYAYHPDVPHITQVLAKAGLEINAVTVFKRPTVVDVTALPKAVRVYSTYVLPHIPPQHRDEYVNTVAGLVAERSPRPTVGKVSMSYIRLRFMATKVASRAA